MGGQPSLPDLDPSKTSYSERGKNLTKLKINIPQNHGLENLDLVNNNIQHLPLNLQNLKLVNLSQNYYSHIPKQIEKAFLSYISLTELILSNNNIQHLPQSFRSLQNLHILTLDNNLLTEFTINLPKLTHLNLMCNKITTFKSVPESLIYLNLNFNFVKVLEFSSQTITNLFLAGNNITSIDPNVTFPSCINCNLAHNRLSNLPPLSPIFPNVSQLSLSFNYLVKVPENIPTRITALALSFNSITDLGTEISNLENLSTFYCNNNYIEALPKLPGNIETLRVDHNRIRQSEKVELNHLKNFQCNNNDFEQIPLFSSSPVVNFVISNNSMLKTIETRNISQCITSCDFTNCQLDSVPEDLFKFTQLRNLILTKNNIREIPPIVEKSYLFSLVVSENPIESLPLLPATIMRFFGANCLFIEFPEPLMRLARLHILDLSGNRITQVPLLPRVQLLNVSCNEIEEMPMLSETIKSADLSHNKIKEAVFKDCSYEHMCELDLSHNEIELIDFENLEKSIPVIQTLKLSHNAKLEGDLRIENYNNLLTLDVLHTKLRISVDEAELEDLPIIEIIADKSSVSIDSPKIKHFDDCTASDGDSLTFDVGYSEMKGNREQMEDSLILKKRIICTDDQTVDAFAVLDGHAGFHASQYCSSVLPLLLSEAKHFSCECIAERIKEMNRLLSEKKIADGTTLAMVLVNRTTKEVMCFNVGDSRALIVKKDGSVFPLTYDHKPDERSEMENIRELGGFVVEGRTSGVLAMSRSLGDFQVKGVTQIPSVTTYPALDDDFRVVIGCDGIFDVISNEEVGRIVCTQSEVSRAAYTLRNIAFTRMSQDNISVIVASI